MNSILKSWKTTLAGVLTLVFAGLQCYHSPAMLMDPQTVATVAGGIGLIVAKDSGVSGTAQ